MYSRTYRILDFITKILIAIVVPIFVVAIMRHESPIDMFKILLARLLELL